MRLLIVGDVRLRKMQMLTGAWLQHFSGGWACRFLATVVVFGQEPSPTPQTVWPVCRHHRGGHRHRFNIPTSEEVGPNPVDTYRREDITRLGVRSAVDLPEIASCYWSGDQ